MNSLTVKE